MFDVLQFGISEAPVLCGSAGDVVTTGVDLYTYAQFGGLGFSVVVSDNGAGIDGNFDIVVQTAVRDADPTLPASWRDTGDRINGVFQFGTYSIPCANPVLDKCRIKIVKNAGTVDSLFALTWLGDRQFILLP